MEFTQKSGQSLMKMFNSIKIINRINRSSLLIYILIVSIFGLNFFIFRLFLFKKDYFQKPIKIDKNIKLINFYNCNDHYCSTEQNNLKMVSVNIPLKKDKYYIVHLSLKEVSSPFLLHIDLYNYPNYDFWQQEKTVFINRDNSDIVVYLNSGSQAPNKGQLRIFYKSPSKIAFSFAIYKLNSLGVFLLKLTTFFFCLSCLTLCFLIYRINPKIIHSVIFIILLAIFFKISCKMASFGSGDTYLNVPTALSILAEGNLDLDEFQNIIPPFWKYAEIQINNHWYLNFPIGEPFIITPIVFFLRFFNGNDLLALETNTAFLVYLTIGFLFFNLILLLTNRVNISYLLSFILSCCTTNITTISAALWTHGGLELMLIITFLLIFLGEKRNISHFLISSSIPLALAYIIRPTASIFIIFLVLYVLIQHKNIFIPFSLLMVSVFIWFILISLINYNSLLPPYYLISRLSFTNFKEALMGQLFSPNRGFFIWQPVFLFSAYGLIYYLKKGPWLMRLLTFSTICFFFILAMFPHWWGGYSYGPRLFTDIIPIMVLLLIPFCQRYVFSNQNKSFKRYILMSLFFLSVSVSFYIQYRGLTSNNVHLWNSKPVSVDKAPQRIWDWHDIQFLRNL